MRKVIAEHIANQVGEWGHRGLIDSELTDRLKRRYATDVTMGGVLLRWLGFLAAAMLGSSLLGLLATTFSGLAIYLAPVFFGGLAYLLWRSGTRLASDPEQHYPTSGAVLVTAGLMAGFAALTSAYELTGGAGLENALPWLMLVIGGAAIFTAYRYGLRWPLILGVLLAFHAVGNMHRYAGHGAYVLGIQDERLSLVIAIATIILGLWHEKVLEREHHRREVGFGQVYIITGLLYANVCLWFLSIPREALVPVLAFSAACVIQIVLGGRFHDGRFTGFGIVFLSINIYTRLFEGFWDELSKGVFFLLSGAIAMAVGVALEVRARNLRAVSQS